MRICTIVSSRLLQKVYVHSYEEPGPEQLRKRIEIRSDSGYTQIQRAAKSVKR